MEPMLFVVLALATYRISRMISNRHEKGPFAIFDRLRIRFGVNNGMAWWQEGLRCPMCVSFWIGQAFALASMGLSLEAVVYGLAFSAVAVFFAAIAG